MATEVASCKIHSCANFFVVPNKKTHDASDEKECKEKSNKKGFQIEHLMHGNEKVIHFEHKSSLVVFSLCNLCGKC